MRYNRCGNSGLLLPAVSLGLWHNFGTPGNRDTQRAICRTAFDSGITHFDLANNYGPPPGSAETNYGELLHTDFMEHRDELVISTKAGYHMWDGPYGEWGSRKSLIASLDQSLKRLGLDYVDIFYSHRFDPDTPLEETMGALDFAVRSGRALYVGISNYPAEATRKAGDILRQLGTPCLIHQPRYNMLQREPELQGVFDAAKAEGMGLIVYSPLAQGLLTNKYLQGVPADSRAAGGGFLKSTDITLQKLSVMRALTEVAMARGQSLAQMAICWALRNGVVTSALIGASKPVQIIEAVQAVDSSSFSTSELATIDKVLSPP
jgi:L-glyceraldehyde 3-phosphate reductase